MFLFHFCMDSNIILVVWGQEDKMAKKDTFSKFISSGSDDT